MYKNFQLKYDNESVPNDCNHLLCIERMEYLTKNERWALYDALRSCGGSFGDDAKQEILQLYNKELNDKFIGISENRIIKRFMDVFNFDEMMILKIYEAIDNKCPINIKLRDGIVLKKIYPSRIFLDDDQNRWYLEHIRGGEPFNVWLKKVTDVELLPLLNKMNTNDEFYKENKKEMCRIKIRVYDERNSRERAIGFLSEKYIINEKICFGYSDITAKVMNLEAFKKWVMEMIPQVVVLEPVELKQEFNDVVNSWVKSYVAGI